jgi:4-amino-4-deoxy-L-arabinose transferase-like glycosyltransferase
MIALIGSHNVFSRIWPVIFVALIASTVLFFRLGESSLRDYDEAIHGQVAREMVESGDWITLSFGGNPRFEKPPLFNWTTALLFRVFEINAFWARAASTLSAIVVFVLTYLTASLLYGRHVGLLTVVPLITTVEFVKQARNGTTDMMLTLFIMLSIYAYYRLRENSPRWWYVFWLSFALAFMTKFWAALIILIAVAIVILLNQRVLVTLQCKHFYWGLALAFAVILPWHLIMIFTHEQFMDRFVFHNLFERSTTALEGNIGGSRFYFDRFQHDFAPWFLLVPITLAISIAENVSNQTRTLLLLVFTICIFGLYSLLVQTKLFHYLTPIYPALAILLAATIAQAWSNYRSPAFGGLVFAAIAATLVPSLRVVVIFVILSGILIFSTKVSAYLVKQWAIANQAQRQQNPLLHNPLKRLVPTIAGLSQPSGLAKLTVALICIFLMSIGLLRSRPLYQIEMSPVERIVRLANETDRDRNDPIIGLALPPNYQDAILGPTAMFYSTRPVKVAWSVDELDMLVSMGLENIMMTERFLERLGEEYQIIVLVESEPFIYGTIQKRRHDD